MNARSSSERAHEIAVCPGCGSRRIRRVQRTVSRSWKGQRYSVPDLRFHECPRCGEKVFDPQAVRQIQERSPAFAKRQRARKSA